MRVLCDTNIFITYLLSPIDPERTVVRLVHAAIEGRFTMVIPPQLILELQQTISKKPHLSPLAESGKLERFLSVLLERSEVLPSISIPATRVTRDPEDDYLLATAAYADVDVLVSGDLDLLVLRDRLTRPAIMTAGEFVQMLDEVEQR